MRDGAARRRAGDPRLSPSSDQQTPARPVAGLTIQSVEPGSVLDQLGVRAGDRLLVVDGLVPRDVIDLQLELPEARSIVVEREDGRQVELRRAQVPTPAPLDPAALTLV